MFSLPGDLLVTIFQGGCVFAPLEKVPVAQAALRLKLSYNQVRRLIAIGEIQGGYEDGLGYYVFAAALEQPTPRHPAAHRRGA